MSVRLGINPLTWTNDDLPWLGAETPLEVCLREGRAAGFSGFELGNKFPRTVETLGPILQRHALSLISGWYSANLLRWSVEEEHLAIEPHLTLLGSLGARVMVLAETSRSIHGNRHTPMSLRPCLTDEHWSEFGRKLTALADHCIDHGVRVAYHPHMGTVVESEADVDTLMAHTGTSVGLLLDTGHLICADADPVAVLRRHGERVCHVHLKDIREHILRDARNRRSSFLDTVLNGVFTVPGDGRVDFPAIFGELKKLDYQGWLVVEAEQDPAVAPSFEFAKLAHANVVKFCERAGIGISD